MPDSPQPELGAHLQRRIVSLLPAATETICAMGLGGKLVGRSHECDYPADVQSLPVCSRARVNPGASSREIHEQILAGAPEAALGAVSIYEVDTALLRELQPTHIVTQTLCDVCAVSEATVTHSLHDAGVNAMIVPTHVGTMAEYWAHFVQMGSMLGATEEAIQLVARLQDRVAVVEEQTLPLVERPRVVSIEWLDPLMTAGNWMPELMELAGGRSVLARGGAASPWVEWEQVLASQPNVMIVSPCGFPVEQTLREVDRLKTLPGWADLPAAREGNVYVVDGNALLHRPGPRLVESLEILASLVQPGLFPRKPTDFVAAFQ